LKGLVFDIQRYSIHDGPGIRTVVFLKGCPLNCLWCCNPESQRMRPELEFRSTLCQQCGKCISVCPEGAINPDVHILPIEKIDRLKCTNCGECVQICPNDALRMSGQWRESEEVFQDCLKDAHAFRRSTGGVTLSGGEPLLQPEFTFEILSKLFDRNIHTAIETTGYAPWKMIESLIPYINLFLFDIKHMNPEKHMAFTGVSNKLPLENLYRLGKTHANIVIRIPFIPGYNDDLENLNAIASLAVGLSVSEVHIMPFHQLGKSKYDRFGYNYQMKNLNGVLESEKSRFALQKALTFFSEAGFTARIGG
jgi:pyruvate formate lyase activating enzyme